MNGKVIPKEQLTAYQRWELGGLESRAAPPAGEVRDAPPREVGPLPLPTAEQLERIHQEAWGEGYRLGEEEGRRAGFAAGQEDARVHAERLRLLAEALDAERLRQDEELAREVLQLALAIAQQVVRTSLRVRPEIILEVVREALMSLPSLTGHTRLVVHPEHAAFVREWLSHEHGHLSWKVIEDADMELGGFRVENAHSELDASMSLRWRDVVAVLGADAAWLG
ncbi:MAG: flagellar assembly protein FliH [Thiobacillaceae bacterium]|jgi:flagellar assembly protein FliH|nr:flagellar assembly protein FliH [Thiobacillaceae bacterium]